MITRTIDIHCPSCNIIIGETRIKEFEDDDGVKRIVSSEDVTWDMPADHDPSCPKFWQSFVSTNDIWEILEFI